MSTPRDPFGPPDQRPSEHEAPGDDRTGGQPRPQVGGAPYGWPSTDQPYGQQPPGPAPYGQPWAGDVGGPKRNGLGVAALVLGVLGLLTSWLVVGAVLGLVAIVLGVLARGRVKRREADNGGMALAGIVLGILSLVVAGAVLAAGAAVFNSDTGRDLVGCLQDAGGDPAATG